MANYDYVNYDVLNRMVQEYATGVDEASIELGAEEGDAWIKGIIEKHGEGAHENDVLVSYATKWAALSVLRGLLGGHVVAADKPLYIQMLEKDIYAFVKGGSRSQIESANVNRGVPEIA